MKPEAASVRYNDWRQVDVPALEAFTPTRPVSVIIPYYQAPAEIAKTLASLEGQTYPRGLFEVVIVDDGSEPPLASPHSTCLNIKVVRQARRGFGLARARNTGVRSAAYDILLFLDNDVLVETDWISAHARWHHVLSDALTLGFHNHVVVDDVDVETIRYRSGPLKELFSDRSVHVPWVEDYLVETNDLTSKADDLFKVTIGGNLGIRKDFYWLLGGSDESFMRFGVGVDDTELGYRAYTQGGLLVPLRDASTWHQGTWEENRDFKRRIRGILRSKAAHLIAHDSYRKERLRRIFTVPQTVVTIEAGHHPAGQVIRSVGTILADRVHDLVVRIETLECDDDDRQAWIEYEFGSDPRVRVATAGNALDEFPTTSFHVRIPAAAVFAKGLVHRLRAALSDAVAGVSRLPDGSEVSITRTWALHRARRIGGKPSDFGDLVTVSAAKLKIRLAEPLDDVDHISATATGQATRWSRLLDRVQDIHSPAEAWSLLKQLRRSVWRSVVSRLRAVRPERLL